jgi:hypothetical protein
VGQQGALGYALRVAWLSAKCAMPTGLPGDCAMRLAPGLFHDGQMQMHPLLVLRMCLRQGFITLTSVGCTTSLNNRPPASFSTSSLSRLRTRSGNDVNPSNCLYQCCSNCIACTGHPQEAPCQSSLPPHGPLRGPKLEADNAVGHCSVSSWAC